MKFIKPISVVFACLMVWSCAKPVADFALVNGEPVAPDKVAFENKSKKATDFLWDFGDGTQSTEATPVHRYVHSGNYLVKLSAKNEKGKSAEITKRIMVKPPKKCLVELQTEYGNMMIELFDETPKHRDNFYQLAEEGFYDELTFHRVIDGFMIQGGDPHSKAAKPGQPLGTGGPGYTVPAEIDPEFIHVKGALAAARQPDQYNPQRKSSGSQFYIVHGGPLTEKDIEMAEQRNGFRYTKTQKEAYLKYGGYPPLDGQYTVFGRIITGLDVIDKIAAIQTNQSNRPVDPVRMKMVVIK